MTSRDRSPARRPSRPAPLGRWWGGLPGAGVLGLALACAGPRPESAERILARAAPPVERVAPAPDPGAPVRAAGDDPVAAWTLSAILERIAGANPTLGAARARLEEARATRREVRASALPELSLGLSYVATDEPAQAFALLLDQEELSLGPGFDPTPGTIENWRKELRLDWPLFAPGRAESRRAAREGEEAARLAGEAVERRLLNAGIQAWLGLRAARELAEVARDSIAVVEERLAVTERRAREGAALRVDVLRLEVRLASVRQEAARAELAVRQAESGLNRLMGRGPDAALVLVAEELAIGGELPADLESLQALAQAERRDLRAAAHDVRRGSFEREASQAQRRPSLQAFAAYDVDGPDPGIDDELDSTTIGVGLRLPLSARTRPAIRRAEARERRAREELRELVLAVAQEVRDGSEGLSVAEETLALAEASVSAAEEAFRLVARAQDAGGATVTDVLEAEDARKGARVRLVAARAGVQIARAKLVAATGGVW